MQPWESQIEMSADIAREIIDKNYPDLDVRTIMPFAQGWDKTAYLVNDYLLFHFTRREVAIQTVESEIRFLPLIAEHLSIPVPQPLYQGYFNDTMPFFAYKLLKGKMIVEARLNSSQRMELAPKLGGILKSLHSIPVTEKLKSTFPQDFLGKLNIEKRTAQIIKNWPVLSKLGIDVSEKFRDHLFSNVSQNQVGTKISIVHGDLYSRHLLVNGTSISGIIDWGDMHLNHPARDLSFAVNYFHPAAFNNFMDSYGPISVESLCLSLFSAMNHTLYVGDYAMQIGDENLVEETKIAFKNIVANYPF